LQVVEGSTVAGVGDITRLYGYSISTSATGCGCNAAETTILNAAGTLELNRGYQDDTETNGLGGRASGYTLDGATTLLSSSYTYDTTGRLATVSDGTDTFTNAYETDSNLLFLLKGVEAGGVEFISVPVD